MNAELLKTWYEMYLQQVAAESYLETVRVDVDANVARALQNGNNRPEFADVPEPRGKTRLTTAQAQEFVSKYQVLHQWSDDRRRDGDLVPGAPGYLELNGEGLLANTGLSATLIQNCTTGAYTLSIRSTEYVTPTLGGDKHRDLDGADLDGIAFSGFAFAQIDALERYYAWLHANIPGLCEEPLYVTGYSLGGHLATVFTELHPGGGPFHHLQWCGKRGLGPHARRSAGCPGVLPQRTARSRVSAGTPADAGAVQSAFPGDRPGVRQGAGERCSATDSRSHRSTT